MSVEPPATWPDDRDVMRIMLLSGSIRQPSYTRALTEHTARALEEQGAVTVHWDLTIHPLPFADPEYHGDPAAHPEPIVRELVGLADGADGFVWSSPVYHNSYSGILKNALDVLAVAQFRSKAVGLVAHAGGGRTTQAVDHLRIVARGLGATAIPAQVVTNREDYERSDDGTYRLVSTTIRTRIDRFATELLTMAGLLKGERG